VIKIDYVKLYHGTPEWYTVEQIMEEGLKPGRNLVGGNYGIFKIPKLFLTPDYHVAEQYGFVIEVRLTEQELEELGAYETVDQIGDKCVVIEAEDEDEVLIDPDDLYQELYYHEMGLCEDDCSICKYEEEEDEWD